MGISGGAALSSGGGNDTTALQLQNPKLSRVERASDRAAAAAAAFGIAFACVYGVRLDSTAAASYIHSPLLYTARDTNTTDSSQVPII